MTDDPKYYVVDEHGYMLERFTTKEAARNTIAYYKRNVDANLPSTAEKPKYYLLEKVEVH